MTCVHLQKLYQLCDAEQIRLSSSDLVHIVCEQCGHHEVCPSVFTDEYEAEHEREVDSSDDAKRSSD